MLNGCGFSVFDSREMQNGHSCELNAPETSSFPVSEATYTVNVTDPTPEPSDEDPFRRTSTLSHAKAAWE